MAWVVKPFEGDAGADTIFTAIYNAGDTALIRPVFGSDTAISWLYLLDMSCVNAADHIPCNLWIIDQLNDATKTFALEEEGFHLLFLRVFWSAVLARCAPDQKSPSDHRINCTAYGAIT